MSGSRNLSGHLKNKTTLASIIPISFIDDAAITPGRRAAVKAMIGNGRNGAARRMQAITESGARTMVHKRALTSGTTTNITTATGTLRSTVARPSAAVM